MKSLEETLAPAAVRIREDLSPEERRRLAGVERDGRVARRLWALAGALDGLSRERAARQAGMDRQALRDWARRYNAEGVEGLRAGRPSRLSEEERAAFRALVLEGADIEKDGVSAWTAKDLSALVGPIPLHVDRARIGLGIRVRAGGGDHRRAGRAGSSVPWVEKTVYEQDPPVHRPLARTDGWEVSPECKDERWTTGTERTLAST